jgi:hypothetical protein
MRVRDCQRGRTLCRKTGSLIARAVLVLRSKHQFKADAGLACGARRKAVSGFERGSMRRAVFCVQNFIYPRFGDHLPRLV